MFKMVWDKTGERLYETGVDRGVLYPYVSGKYKEGKPWNGLTAVNESPSGAEPNALYADNTKYLNLLSVEELGLTIEAYSYPEEFSECLGEIDLIPGISIGQQSKKHFGFSYRTLVGNDEEGTEHGYKIHLVFNCLASPSEKSHSTVNDSPDATSNSWDVTTTPVQVDEKRQSASIVLDYLKFKAAGLLNVFRAIEDTLYGTSKAKATLPVFSEIQELFQTHMYLRDSAGDLLLDSSGNPIQSVVTD